MINADRVLLDFQLSTLPLDTFFAWWPKKVYWMPSFFILHIWAATWQNQQSECAPSTDSDQPGHLPSMIRVFAVRMKKAWVLSYPLSAQRGLWSDWLCWFCHVAAHLVISVRKEAYRHTRSVVFEPPPDKTCLCHMQITKLQISLFIHAASLTSTV